MNRLIKQAATEAGFDACGIARAEALPDDALALKAYLDAGKHGDMHYLARNSGKRTDPRLLVPGCQSVVVVLLNYNPEKVQEAHLPHIGKYAYSAEDYHSVMKRKLNVLENKLIALLGNDCVSSDYQHSFVDTAPILEKRWAERAGLGWIGRHSQLIHPRLGSYTFIGIILIQKELDEYDQPHPYRCGTCNKCIVACPTGALIKGETMDARKCIAYLTLETKTDIPDEMLDKMSGYIAGCDICSRVCPWNKRFSVPHKHHELTPDPAIYTLDRNDWLQMNEPEFARIFAKSAVKRAKLNQIKKILLNQNRYS